jgi:urease accessory protein
MDAHARLAVSAEAGHTRIGRLRSDPPIVLRPTRPTGGDPPPGWELGGAAGVSLASSAAGPIGGDRLRLDVDVGPGARLVLRTVAATLALPGPHGQPSHSTTTLRVAGGGTLAWLPEPLIAATHCDHHSSTLIDLEPGARLLAREELILGRHHEPPGTVEQRLRVTQAGRPLHDQNTGVGALVPGWEGPAVTGGRKAAGSILLAGPDSEPPEIPALGGDAAVLPLGPSAVLVTALAHDAHTLHRRLDEHLAAVQPSDRRSGTRAVMGRRHPPVTLRDD